MPPRYHPLHWRTFTGIPYTAQGAVGASPHAWAIKHKLAGVPTFPAQLSNHPLTRHVVRSICQNPNNPVLFGYVCAMAWGGQGGGRGGARHVASAWADRSAISGHLDALRGGLSRADAYLLFLKRPIPGLGPSFFTKLLYFFSPEQSHYIMDQWTAKSVNLLTGRSIVRMAGHLPSTGNKSGNYQAFCEEIDRIAQQSGCSGEIAEERLFSRGGRHPRQWRNHVRSSWPPDPPHPRYSASAMHALYRHIPQHLF